MTKSRRTTRRAYLHGEPTQSLNAMVIGGVFALLIIGMLVGVLVMQMMGGSLGGSRSLAAGSNITRAQQESAATATAAAGENASTPRVDLGTAKALFDQKQAVMVDARGQTEFGQGHISGATNISLFELQQKLTLLPTDKAMTIIAYCS